MQALWRSAFSVTLDGHEYTLDVDFFDWNGTCVLYRDGVQAARQSSPARFDLNDLSHDASPDAMPRIEATVGWYGMQRAHLITADGEQQLLPVPGTGEHGRAQLARKHPGWSAVLAVASFTVLLLALLLELPQLLEVVTHTSWWSRVADWQFTSPISLPSQANTVITVAGVLAGIERGLRLRHNWLLDQ